MAKQFPLDKRVCLDAIGRELLRGDFVLMPTSWGFDLGIVKKPGKTTQAEGAVVTKLIRRYGYDNRTASEPMMYKIPKNEAVSMLTLAKLRGEKSVCPAGEQLLIQIERQRTREIGDEA